MDNQEAIASLKTLCHTCDLFPKCVNEKHECFEAIELAISALQAQADGDCISRHAAIDAINTEADKLEQNLCVLQAQGARRWQWWLNRCHPHSLRS